MERKFISSGFLFSLGCFLQFSSQFLYAYFEYLTQCSVSSLIEHPVNVYLLYKHLRYTLPLWKSLRAETSYEANNKISQFIQGIPSKADLDGVALSLLRLQDVYNLSTKSLLDGSILGLDSCVAEIEKGRGKVGKGLDKEDCFLLADVASQFGLREQYRTWFAHCMEMLDYQAEIKVRKTN